MARVLCQVLPQTDRLTLLWSDIRTTFAPYSIEGAGLAELHRLAAQAHGQLAKCGAAVGDDAAVVQAGYQLAQIGHALYRLLFQLDRQGDAPGQEVGKWLDGVARAGAMERLEILGDAFTVPWIALYDRPPEPAAFTGVGFDAECWRAFWGRRSVVAGPRVPWLRSRELPEKPVVVLAIDPEWRACLPADEQQRLSQFQTGHALSIAESWASLVNLLETQDADLLGIFGRAQGAGIRLGNDLLTAEVLESIAFARAEEEGPLGQTAVFLNACPGSEPGNLLAAFERFGRVGLVGTVQPLAAPLANCCGLELVANYLKGGQYLADALTAMQQRYPVAGAIYFGCFPCDPGTSGEGAEPLSLPDEPYQPLTPLQEDSALLLVGREFDIAQLACLLDDAGARLVLVHGAPGAGKASLLHAGLVPYLEDQSVGYQFLRERADVGAKDDEIDYPVLAIRATSDLAGQLAIALLEFCGRPYSYITPTGATITVDLPALLGAAVQGSARVDSDLATATTSSALPGGAIQGTPGGAVSLPATEDLRVALRHDNGLLSRVLQAVTAQLPFELVVLIEQGEELFSLVDADVEPRAAVQLDMLRAALAGPGRFKCLVSLRTAYLGRFLAPLVQTPQDSRWARAFLVRELTEDELIEVVLQPTSPEPPPGTEEVPQEAYGFQFEQGLAEQIAKEALQLGGPNQESPLALVQVVCSRLFNRVAARQEKVVRAEDLKAIGGVDRGLGKYVGALVKSLRSWSDRKVFADLLKKLITRQPDGSVTRDLHFEKDLRSDWQGSASLQEVVAKGADDDIRLFNVSYLNVGGKEGNFLSLGHDALATAVASQVDEATKKSYGRTKFTDALWVTIPLVFMLGAFALKYISTLNTAIDKRDEELKLKQELIENSQPRFERLSGMRWPAYVGLLHAADQAMQTGDLVRARQALVALKPVPGHDDVDTRGFEWHYLWHQMHRDQATLYGHRGTVNAVALTPDGLTLATTDEEGTVRLWNAMAGRELAKLEPKDKKAGRGLAFSPDGSLLAAGGDDTVIRLWKVDRTGLDYGHNAAAVVGPLPLTGCPALSALSQFAVRRVVTPVRPLPDLTDHKEAVLSLAFSPDGKTLASASKDGTVCLWDLTGTPPKLKKTLKEHQGAVNAIAYSPDGKLLASAGADGKVVIWDGKTGAAKTTLEGHPEEVNAVAWSGDGKTLATGGTQTVQLIQTGIIKLWETAKWKPAPGPAIAVAPVFALAFTSDGKTLATAGKDSAVQSIDTATGRQSGNLQGHLAWVRCLAVARGGAVIASGSLDGTAKIWLPQEREQRDLLKVSSEPVGAVSFSLDQRWLATGSGDGVVKLWNIARGEVIKAMPGHKGAVLALAWDTGGRWLVSGGADGQLKLWDADPKSKSFGSELHAVKAHAKDVTCLVWPDKDGRLVSGSLDGTVKLWKVADGKFGEEPTEIKTGNAVYCLAYLPLANKSELLATGQEDAKIRLWNATTGKLFLTGDGKQQMILTGHTGPVTAMALILVRIRQDDDRMVPVPRLITGSQDQSIKFWELRSGQAFYTSRGHAGPVISMAISQAHLDTLVTGSTDRMVKLWDPDQQEERWTLSPRVSTVHALAITQDGRTIAAGGQDGTVRIYRSSTDDNRRK